MSFSVAHTLWLSISFIIAFLLGLMTRKHQFCTMGAVSDWVIIGDRQRAYAWCIAIIIGIFGVGISEYADLINLDQSFPAYRQSSPIWLAHVIGGLAFGVGMALSSGCIHRNLIRAGNGSLRAVTVLLTAALSSYTMIYPTPLSSDGLFVDWFQPWLSVSQITLNHPSDLGGFLFNTSWLKHGRLTIALICSTGLLYWIYQSQHRQRLQNSTLYLGIALGTSLVALWLISSLLRINNGQDSLSLYNYAMQWDFFEDEQQRPALLSRLRVQSFSFIASLQDGLHWLLNQWHHTWLSSGLMLVFGTIVSSSFYALISKQWHFEEFTSFQDAGVHIIGALLMGIGGVLAMGCSFTQGLSGLSTLATSSVVSLLCMLLACAFTLKWRVYHLFHPQVNIWRITNQVLLDFHLSPFRRYQLPALD